MSEFWKDKRVCVTGGAGFLGSFVLEKLRERGSKDIFVHISAVERSGLTGISQLAIDFEGASDRGMSNIAGISGPTASQLGDWLSRPASQNIPKAIPLLGQTQGGRDAIRALL